MRGNAVNLRAEANYIASLVQRRDALSNYACGIFVAKAGSGSDRGWCPAGAEGLSFPSRKIVLKGVKNNPSVGYADSSLCTREPFGQKRDAQALCVRKKT